MVYVIYETHRVVMGSRVTVASVRANAFLSPLSVKLRWGSCTAPNSVRWCRASIELQWARRVVSPARRRAAPTATVN